MCHYLSTAHKSERAITANNEDGLMIVVDNYRTIELSKYNGNIIYRLRENKYK